MSTRCWPSIWHRPMQFVCFGLPVRFSFSFFLITTLFLLADTTGTVLFVLSAAVIHELGHILTMALLGAPILLLDFTPFGLKIVRGGRLLSYRREAVVSLSGAGANLLAAGLLALLGGQSFGALYLSAVNLAVGVFHLLPLRGLDGGRIAAELLALHLSPSAARTASGAVSLFFLGLLGALAGWLWLTGRGNLSLAVMLLYFVRAFFKG